jgi:hypothetical protein
MVRDELTKGMASIGHILLGNHDVFHTNGSTPIVSFYPVQANCVGSLDPTVKLCPEQHFHHHAWVRMSNRITHRRTMES